MSIVRFCVMKKVTVGMLAVLTAILGLIAFFRLDQEFMPELDFPQLVILTNYSNASSQEVENLVTRVIEEAAGTVKNVRSLHSSSKEGLSAVTVEFGWGTNMDHASLNLREKVDLAKPDLPDDCGEPRIERFNPFAMPVVSLSLSGSLNDKELLAVARRPVSEMIEKCAGVASVTIAGGREREILVELNQSSLASRNLSIMSVARAISRSNLTFPAGAVKDDTYEYAVRVIGTCPSPAGLGRIPVAAEKNSKGKDSRLILLSSLGTVRDTLADAKSFSRLDGKANITLSVLKQSEANVVRVAEAVKGKIPEIQARLPKGVKVDLIEDQSRFIESGISSMLMDCALGGLLAFLALAVFLGHWKEALGVCTAIPLSVLATLFMMDLKGMTLNMVSLAGLAIGIGILVDAAIIVQENIARHKESGKPSQEAAISGAEEILPAAVGSILTTVAVFFPLVFVEGVVGQIFRDLSWTVLFSQLASLAAASTVIPLLASRLSSGNRLELLFLRKIDETYRHWLGLSIGNCRFVLGIAAAACLLSVALLSLMPRSLLPRVRGTRLALKVEMPSGTPLERTNGVVKDLENLIKDFDPGAHWAAVVGSIPREGFEPLGPNQGQITVDFSNSRGKISEFTRGFKEKLKTLNLQGGRIHLVKQNGGFSFFGSGGQPVEIEVKGHDLVKMEKTADRIAAELKNVKGLQNIKTDASVPAPEVRLEINREALAAVSLSVADLAESVAAAVHGKVVSKFHEEGKEFDIRLRLRPEDRESVAAVERLAIHSPMGLDVPIGRLSAIRFGKGPGEIIRKDKQRTLTISAGLSGRSISSVSKDLEKVIRKIPPDKDIRIFLAGESVQMAESFRSLKIILILSMIFIFMIMASEFENLKQPFLIMATIPFSLIGVAAGLILSGHELTVMTGMGLILLAGIVVDNGIVLIDFVNLGLAEGKPLKEALVLACQARLRPILMTALTTVLGMLPLALGIGQGSEIQSPMAVVVVSGLTVSTVLTLLVLPALILWVCDTVA